MNFRLEKSTASTAVLAKFNVRNSANDIVGTVSVKPSEEADLLACWRGGAPAAGAAGAMLAAHKRERPVSKAALRGC